MVKIMDTIGLQLSDCELQMFGQLFTYYDSENTGIVSQSVAKQLLNSSQLEQKVLDQIIELSFGSSRLPSLSRQQFYVMLKLVGAAQSGLPLNTDTLQTNALTIPLPQLSPLIDMNKQQSLVHNSDENLRNEIIYQISGHLPPPPTKPSVRPNRRNNQFSNSDNVNRKEIETTNNYSNNAINNHINYEQSETTNSRSSSDNETNDSPIDPIIDKSYDYRDKSWSEFSDKTKDKPLNWADFDEEHHLLENEEEDDEEEQEIKSNVSSDEDTADIWNISADQRIYYTNQFKSMQTNLTGIIKGNKAKDFFEKSNLPIQELSQIWQLSDVDKDGALNLNEFCIAMHLVVLRRNNIELPSHLPPILMPLKSPNETNSVQSLNSTKCLDLVTDCETLSPQHNDHKENLTKNVETLSPKSKQWTKFNDSPTNQIIATTVSPPSTSSSAGLQLLANFDFNTASIVRDPKILHPVALRLSPDGQPLPYETTDGISQNIDTGVHSVSTTDTKTTVIVIHGKKDPPPPPPPRPNRSHARSSSLDLNKLVVRSVAANDLISSQNPLPLKVSNSEYGLTAPHKEYPVFSLNTRNVGAFHAYKKTRAETSLTNNSLIEALKNRYKPPPEVPIPENSNDSTDLWQTIRSFQEYSKALNNLNNDLLRELIRVSEDKHSLETRLAKLNNGCKL